MEDFSKFVGFLICMILIFFICEAIYSKKSDKGWMLVEETSIEAGKRVYYDTDNDIEFSCQLSPKGIKQVQSRTQYENSLK